MKTMKRALAVFLALVMVLALGTTVFAATITMKGGAEGSEYAAFRLLNVTDGGEGKFAYTVNEKYRDVLQAATGKTTDAEIIAHIGGMASDSEAIQSFADAVYAQITQAGLAADATTKNDKFEGVHQGYYLIAETKAGSDGDTYSLVMLNTAGQDEITIDTKENTPSLDKKVQEKNDSTGDTSGWQDGADYDIGDHVPFQLTGTVSNKYDSYKTYYYAFHDKMSAGLTFDEGSVVVKVDGTVIDASNYTVVYPATDGCTFDVIFTDLKQITGATVTKDSKITVEFTATLNDKAVIGAPGNPNEAKLEYSNNPYDNGEGKPETGETPWDKVVVFTYELIADKVDGEGKPLEGAGFTLYKYDAVAKDYVAVGDQITGQTTFTFTGLDAGQYKLVKTTVPDGYNKADDIYFTIEATYDTDSTDPKLTVLVVKDQDGNIISEGESAVFNTSITDGSVNTKVKNLAGHELPSTGSIGTTIFYIVGGVLMAGAVILLVTRKKLSARKDS